MERSVDCLTVLTLLLSSKRESLTYLCVSIVLKRRDKSNGEIKKNVYSKPSVLGGVSVLSEAKKLRLQNCSKMQILYSVVLCSEWQF